MKLIAAGLGRTGTGSITMALEQLGLSTLSQETLFSNLQNHAHVNAVLRGESALDWSLFEGVDATLGWPLCFLYRELLGKFPEAKCLLNVRDPEPWFDSVSRSWDTLRMIRSAKFFSRFRYLNETFDDLQIRFGGPPEKGRWIAAYQAHVESVMWHVPSDRLVIYRVEEGWQPICDLLGLPVPDTVFPRENVGGEASFRKKIKSFVGLS